MNAMRLIMALAALSGRPIRLSSVAAPDDDPDSLHLRVEPAGQIRPGRGARSHRGIPYAARGRTLRMDILTPRTPGPHPLVLYLPGGGFVTARRAMAARPRRHVTQVGFVVAAIDYRTASPTARVWASTQVMDIIVDFLRSRLSTAPP
ncbi:alpha/beta hydrolase family protein [Sphaerisporangium corydalis]|uniref:Alpha/beta hydrolase family protein n=1 Tax=Sphaerisporangium corydalis TaxID=1441875 RepID=A0ABV9EJK8_9ACTN|nr:hypothetical protein [Sphaerisporangium corydalis]